MKEPFVSVLTPVYNGERYLAECIESVLKQTYGNWEYIIVNNCSTDKTLAIADDYALKDPRIKVCTNKTFVGVIENHNNAFGLISPQSEYTKVVSADDWISPEFLAKTVRVMEAHPNVVIVGAYQRREEGIMWKGVPVTTEAMPGRAACRLALIDELAIFGPPTSVLYRSEIVRKNNPFFSTTLPNADTCANFEYLQHHDFGFVHEVLSFERIHKGRVSTKVARLNMGDIASVDYIVKYGPLYLNSTELASALERVIKQYYECLGGCVLKLKGKEFWTYHAKRMRELGHPISWRKVAQAALRKAFVELRRPRVAVRKALRQAAT